MGFSCVLSRETNPAQNVFTMANRFEVRRAHAPSVAAEVVYLQAIRDRTSRLLVRYSVDSSHGAIDSYLSVSATIDACRPDPTIARLVYFLPESLTPRPSLHHTPQTQAPYGLPML